jgi:hypothetical protein
MSFDAYGREVTFSPDGSTLMVSADGVDDTSSLPIRFSLGAVYTYVRNADGKYVQANRRLPADTTVAFQYFGRYVTTDARELRRSLDF